MHAHVQSHTHEHKTDCNTDSAPLVFHWVILIDLQRANTLDLSLYEQRLITHILPLFICYPYKMADSLCRVGPTELLIRDGIVLCPVSRGIHHFSLKRLY